MHRVWLAFLLILFAGCTETGVEESASALPDVSVAPSASADEPASPEATPEATPAASESSQTTLGEGWTVPFAMTVPSEWERSEHSTGSMFEISAGTGRFVTFTQQGPPTVDEWITLLTSTEQIEVTEPEAEGGPGICMNPGADRCWTLFEDPGGFWSVDEGRTNRLWIVDVGGETVLIVTEASEAGFDDWTAIVEEALATLAWAE